MAGKRNRREKRAGSLIWNTLDGFTAYIYSLFMRSRIGNWLSSKNTLSRQSYIATTLNAYSNESSNKTRAQDFASAVERNAIVRMLAFIRMFFSSLKLNVYGSFFVFYGLASIIAYFMSYMMNGHVMSDVYTLISAIIITVISVPLLFSTQSAAEAISKSRLVGNFVIDFLDIPEEKLKTKKTYGRTEYIFIAIVIGLALGLLTYFIHPLYVPSIFIALVVISVMFSNPETGILITLAAAPFLQYVPYSEEILLILIVVTALSYIAKIIQKRRIISFGPEMAMVFLFCGFIVISGFFSDGGQETFKDSLISVAMILGGFFLTYNLIYSEKILKTCTRILTASLVILSLIGLWNIFYNGVSYNGISDRISDTVGSDIASISNDGVLYLADNGAVFGAIALLIFPLICARTANEKSGKSVVALLANIVIIISAAWMCSHYEIVIALVIELLIFWIMHSHKSLTAVIIAAIPLSAIMLIYPYAVANWGLPDIVDMLMEYMPSAVVDSSYHSGMIKSVCAMISDGNILGIGAGEHAFETIHAAYANAASAGLSTPTSLWLQVLCWSGIFGLIAFVTFIVFLFRRSLGFFIDLYHKNMRSMSIALFCALFVSLLFGSVYGLWSDARVLYLFWAIAGLLMGHIRVGNEWSDKKAAELSNMADSTDADLVFYK